MICTACKRICIANKGIDMNYKEIANAYKVIVSVYMVIGVACKRISFTDHVRPLARVVSYHVWAAGKPVGNVCTPAGAGS